MSPPTTGRENQVVGKQFEELFFRQAQRSGLLPLKNHLACRFLYGGRVQVIKGELDFKLITQEGRTGYFDCKSYQDDHFTYSMIEPKQIERSQLYNDWNVPSGFVVWFRKANAVCFFPGRAIALRGPGSRFERKDGIFLGRFENFNLKAVMAAYSPPTLSAG